MWTDRQLKALKPRERAYRRSEPTNQRGTGRLMVEVQPTGNKALFFQYWRDGKKELVSIGRFKLSAASPGLTLSEAREQANVYSTLLQKGVDVKTQIKEKVLEEEKRQRKVEAAKRQGTLEQLIDSYISAMEADGKRSHESVRRSLKTYLSEPFPELVKRKADTIEADDIRMVLSQMIDNGVTTHTNRVRAYLHAAFAHGLKQDNNPRRYAKEATKFNLQYNPVAFVPKQGDYERVGEHVISEKEIRLIWKELPKVSQMTGWAVKLAFTTGQRLGEILRVRWCDIDAKDRLLTIPSSVSKNKIDHVVPLDKLSWAIIQDMKKVTGKYEHCFPASNNAGFIDGKPIFNTTVAKVIREYCEDHKKVKKFLGRDIRRTVKTLMGKAGIDKAIRDRVQNHALQDVSSKHYDRYDYLPEKREGLKIWNDYLDLIINPDKKVSHIGKKRA